MYLDIFLIVVMLISGMLAMVRGLIREVLSIAGWGAAAGAALYAYAKLLPSAKAYFNNDYVAIGVTTAGSFLVTLIIVSIITVKISDKILDSRIGALDRTLGFLFGATARGLAFIVVGGVCVLRLVSAEVATYMDHEREIAYRAQEPARRHHLDVTGHRSLVLEVQEAEGGGRSAGVTPHWDISQGRVRVGHPRRGCGRRWKRRFTARKT